MNTRIQSIELDPDLYLYKECSNFTYFIIIIHSVCDVRNVIIA